MRRLAFPAFLGKYMRGLSYSDTASIRALAGEAAHDNPRLREPLYLYALSVGREDMLLKAVRGTPLQNEYEQMSALYSYRDIIQTLENTPEKLPEGYQKVWRSYVCEAEMPERDGRVKQLMRSRILELKNEKGLSVYMICRELGLNRSRVSAWLKGTSDRVGLNTARRILDYTEHSRPVRRA